MKSKVIVGVIAYVGIAALGPWSILFAAAAESGQLPTQLTIYATSFASAIGALTALKAYTSGSYAEFTKDKP